MFVRKLCDKIYILSTLKLCKFLEYELLKFVKFNPNASFNDCFIRPLGFSESKDFNWLFIREDKSL